MMGSFKNESFDEKYCFGTNDGEKIFWNISKMRSYIKKHNIPKKIFLISDLYKFNKSPINEEHAIKTDYNIPGLIVELIEGKLFYKLIDGNHRLYKAKISGETTFSCYYFSFDEQIKFVVDINDKNISLEYYNRIVENIIN